MIHKNIFHSYILHANAYNYVTFLLFYFRFLTKIPFKITIFIAYYTFTDVSHSKTLIKALIKEFKITKLKMLIKLFYILLRIMYILFNQKYIYFRLIKSTFNYLYKFCF
jgi:hypothetical protein